MNKDKNLRNNISQITRNYGNIYTTTHYYGKLQVTFFAIHIYL